MSLRSTPPNNKGQADADCARSGSRHCRDSRRVRRIRQHCSMSYQAVAIILPLCLVFPRLSLSYSTLADRGITPLVHVGPMPLLREGLRLLGVCLTAPPFDSRSPAGSRPPRR